MKRKAWIAAGLVGLTATVGLNVATEGGSGASGPLCTQNTYGRGSSGQCVKDIQGLLNNDVRAGLTVDGSYGPLTANAVRWFQAVDYEHHFPTRGVVDASTWTWLCANALNDSAAVLYWKNASCGWILYPWLYPYV